MNTPGLPTTKRMLQPLRHLVGTIIMFTMCTSKLILGTRTKHGLHTKLGTVALSCCDDGARESKVGDIQCSDGVERA